MSWGVKITMLYVGFVAMIISMVALTMREKVDLVAKDYYAQELQFQDKIDKTNRANSLIQQLSWMITKGKMELRFPEEFKSQKINGTIYFFRPSDSSMDKTIEISNESGTQVISTDILNKGLYKIQIDWKVGENSYYNEGVITIK